MQLFLSDKEFVKAYGMRSDKEFLQVIKIFCKQVGVPIAFIFDPSVAQTKNEVRAFCHTVCKNLLVLEESKQHENRSEIYILFMKEGVRKDTPGKNSPDFPWYYDAEQ